MKTLTVSLEDNEYAALRELAVPDENGKLAIYACEQGNNLYQPLVALFYKGLVTLHFTGKSDINACYLSSAGCFLMDWKSTAENKPSLPMGCKDEEKQ